MYLFHLILPSETYLRQGNVFTGVCQSFCPQGVSSRHRPWPDIPLVRHPLGQTLPSGQTVPWADTPWQTPSWPETASLGRNPPLGRHPTWQINPPPPSRHQLQRTVRILLECILVGVEFLHIGYFENRYIHLNKLC